MTKVGKYELVRKLAAGGMAEVYLARCEWAHGLEKTVVVKRILEHMSEESHFIEMFFSEAQLASRLNHPHIVQIIEFGESEGIHFLAMEYIDGPSLRELLRTSLERGELLPFAHCARIVACACEALAYAHELADPVTHVPLQLIHRDVSLDNILISKAGAVKLVDFGIAKAVTQVHRTKTGVIKGKLSYMSPEQIRGEPLDRRVDVYGLGVLLYELITGAKPFESTNEAQLLHEIMRSERIPPRARRPDTPPELERIINRALERDRGLRYSDCRVMHAELESFLLAGRQPVNAFQLAELVAHHSGEVRPLAPGELPPTRAAPLEPSLTGDRSEPAIERPFDPDPDATRPSPLEVTGEPAGTEPPTTLDRPRVGQARAGSGGGKRVASGPRPRVRGTRAELVALISERPHLSIPAGIALFLGALLLVVLARGVPASPPAAADPNPAAAPQVTPADQPPPPPDQRQAQLEKDRQKARELLDKAKPYLLDGDLAPAEPLLVACLQLDADNADCHLALSTMYVRQKNRAQALIHVRRFLKLQPDRAMEAQDVFQDLRALTTTRAAHVRAPAARAPATHGPKVAAGAKPAAAPDPATAEPSDQAVASALCEEGKLLLKQKQYQQAESLFASCVELDRGNAECHLGLGTSWTRLGSPEKAAPYYREFLRLDPSHPLAKEIRKALQQPEKR